MGTLPYNELVCLVTASIVTLVGSSVAVFPVLYPEKQRLVRKRMAHLEKRKRQAGLHGQFKVSTNAYEYEPTDLETGPLDSVIAKIVEPVPVHVWCDDKWLTVLGFALTLIGGSLGLATLLLF